MSRIKIQVPSGFSFTTNISIRITDLNYGGHVGNDTILSLVHEARMQFLKSHGYDEMNVEGVGLIMSDAGIEFKAELFYGDQVTAMVAAQNFSSVGFDLYYKLIKADTVVAFAKTGMICFDYEKRRVARMPTAAIEKLSQV